MKKWIKIPLVIAGSFIFLIVIAWLILAAYISSNKESLLKNITAQLNENINGSFAVEDMNLAILKGFPGISVALENVTLRDSLWNSHKHDLLNARHIYVSVDVFSLLKKSPRIKDINIADASIYMFIDSSGYTNASVFDKDDSKTKKKGKEPQINHVSFTDVVCAMDNRTQKKKFMIDFSEMVASAKYNDTGWVARVSLDALIKDFTFNEEKGSFFKNKRLRCDLKIHFDKESKTIYIPRQQLRFDNDKVEAYGRFMFINSPPQFSLVFKAKQIVYKNAVALASDNIRQKLNLMDVKNPVDLYTFIDGKVKFRDTPIVKVSWVVKNNVFITPGGEITDCSFTGYFINSNIPGRGTNDRNSLISVPLFVGQYAGIPFKADSVIVTNLIYPLLTGHFTSSFKLDKLNNAISSEALSFTSGNANLDLMYKGGLSKDDPTEPFLKGYASIRDLGFTYIPRNISFTHSDVTLFFTGQDLLVRKTKLQSKSSVLYVDGTILNFLNLYYTAPEKILLNWNIKSPLINLNEFQSLLSARKKLDRNKNKENKNSRGAARAARQLDEVLDKSNVQMKLDVAKIVYKKFTAIDITAKMLMDQTGIAIRDASVKNSDGILKMSADIIQKGKMNDVALQADIAGVNVQKFFNEFSNFGQKAIKSENIKGSLIANVDAKTKITDAGEIIEGSMFGKVDFKLKNGELNNFEPFLKIGKFAFRNRNLSNVTFKDIKNTLELQGDKIIINPMRIESSAFNLAVEGVYGLNGGTNIFIDLPLRNPKKDAMIEDDSLRAVRSMKGIILRLQAVDGDDGKVHIKLRSSVRKRAESLRKQQEEEANQNSR